MLLISGFFIVENSSQDSSKYSSNDVVLEAKIDNYDNLNEVEDASDIIVFGKKVYEDEPTITIDENGLKTEFYTLSGFKIESIEQNDKSLPVKKGEVITILENEVYDKSENITYHIAGYNKMVLDNEYLLLLRYADGNKWYVPTGVITGKIPYDEKEIISSTDEKEILSDIKEVASKARVKYDVLSDE